MMLPEAGSDAYEARVISMPPMAPIEPIEPAGSAAMLLGAVELALLIMSDADADDTFAQPVKAPTARAALKRIGIPYRFIVLSPFRHVSCR